MIALFEAGNWLHSLLNQDHHDVTMLRGDVYVQAVEFARNRTHHQLAFALMFDPPSKAWVWVDLAVLRLPEDPRHKGTKQARFYEQHLQGRPVREALSRIEGLMADAFAT